VQLGPTTRAMLDGIRRILEVDDDDPVALIERTGIAAGFLRSTVRTTSNPTLLEAGYKHNVIPDRAEALVDVRPFAGQEQTVLAELREIAGPDVEVEIVHLDVGLENPFSGALVERMVGALKRHDPDSEVLPYLLSGGTDNKALSELGIAGYGFAPLRLGPELDFPAMFHGVDERVPLEALAFGRAVLTDFLLEA
jgi:acetylornithine deacetylase/succinyl-diaminopimelate desuccinylase-like protein